MYLALETLLFHFKGNYIEMLVSLWQSFIRSETFGANFQEQSSHQISVWSTLVNMVSKAVSCLRWSKRMQSSPLIVVVVVNSWPVQQCKKLFYNLLCAEISTNSFLMRLTTLLTTLQFSLKSVAKVDCSTISICLMERGQKIIWAVY